MINGAKKEGDRDNEWGGNTEFTKHDKETGAPGGITGHPEKETAEAVEKEKGCCTANERA